MAVANRFVVISCYVRYPFISFLDYIGRYGAIATGSRGLEMRRWQTWRPTKAASDSDCGKERKELCMTGSRYVSKSKTVPSQ